MASGCGLTSSAKVRHTLHRGGVGIRIRAIILLANEPRPDSYRVLSYDMLMFRPSNPRTHVHNVSLSIARNLVQNLAQDHGWKIMYELQRASHFTKEMLII